MLPTEPLDATDIELLRALQTDGRLSNSKLATRFSLSETACWRRLKRLETVGIISGYQACLNRQKLGYGVIAFAQVSFGNHAGDAPLRFERQVLAIPEILACHNVSGDCDYLLQIVADDLESYGRFVREVLRKLPGVTAIRSNLSLREIKASSILPLD